MAEDHWYAFSEESDDKAALLNHAYDRWEQLGGAAAARGPPLSIYDATHRPTPPLA